MSKPAYMRNTRSPISVIIYAETLTKYIFSITNNEKQFSKAMRYTLSDDLRNTALKLTKALYNSVSIRPKYKGQYKKRKKYQQKAYHALVELKSLINIANSVANIKNLEYLANLFIDVAEALDRFIKNDKRTFGNLPTKKEYNRHNAYQLARRELLREQKESMRRNENGFIVLTHK